MNKLAVARMINLLKEMIIFLENHDELEAEHEFSYLEHILKACLALVRPRE